MHMRLASIEFLHPKNFYRSIFLCLLLSLSAFVPNVFANDVIRISTVSFDAGEIGSDQVLCAGRAAATLTSIQLATGGAGTVTYQWQASSDNQAFTDIASATGTIYVPGFVYNTTYYRRKAKDDNGEAFSNVVTITVNEIPSQPIITTSSATAFCAGQHVELTSSPATSYQWYLEGIVIDGAISQTYSTSITGSYTVIVKNSNGCSSQPASAVAVISNPIPSTPTLTVTGDTSFCPGGSVILSSSDAPYYQWYIDGVAIEGATFNTYIGQASGAYTVVVTNYNGCSSAPSLPKSITLYSEPATPSITAGGPTEFCQGSNVVLTSSNASAYQWFKDGAPINAATTANYTATMSGIYTVDVKNAQGCSSGTSSATLITVTAASSSPSITGGGPTSFCQGGQVVLTSSNANAFQWYKDGVLITNQQGQTYTATTSGAYTVKVKSETACESTASDGVTVTVFTLPVTPTIAAATSTSLCPGDSVILSSASATSYQWYKNGEVIQLANARNIIVKDSGRYSVTVQNVNGCSSTLSAAVSVTLKPAPAAPDTIYGPIYVFASADNIYRVDPVDGATNYTWTLPMGWSGFSSSDSMAVKAGRLAGIISVTANTDGCASGPTTLFISIVPDSDMDGVVDVDDLDDDNDGILDSVEASACSPTSVDCDTDGDGIPNVLDLDSDGDGIKDVYEAGGVDVNNDGKADGAVDANGIPVSASGGLNPPDTDDDGNLDPYDAYSNNEGIPDGTILMVWKTASAPIVSSDGSVEITYTFTLTNTRPEPIEEVQIKEDLIKAFPLPMEFIVLDLTSNGILKKSTAFDGRSSVNLLTSGVTLPGNTRDSIKLKIRVRPNGYSGDVNNLVDVYALSSWGLMTRQSIDITRSNGRLYGDGLPTRSFIDAVTFLVPDIITPNNDGLNDKLIISRPSNVRISLKIFNRWGSLVYHSTDYKNDWDGTSSNGFNGNRLPQGTYYYIVESARMDTQSREFHRGYLMIKRDQQ